MGLNWSNMLSHITSWRGADNHALKVNCKPDLSNLTVATAPAATYHWRPIWIDEDERLPWVLLRHFP
jgi:hypothetical protein